MHENNWFLSTGINREKERCWLRCGANMPHDETFKPLPPVGAQLYGYTDTPEGVTFYPEIFYRGMRVWPQSWDFESEAPVLHCLAMPANLGDLDSDYFHDIALAINARYPCDVLLADGWERPGRGEYTRFLHVDDLEKIEGPPPEGPF